MVIIHTQEKTASVEIVIVGNQSATWADNKRYLILQIGLSLFFILPVIALGYWIILIFAVLFYAALVTCFWLVAREQDRVERLCITQDEIKYAPPHQAHIKPKDEIFSTRFPRNWIQIELLQPAKKWYPVSLILRSHGCVIEIGRKLTDSEKQKLKTELEKYLDSRFDFAAITDDKQHALPDFIDKDQNDIWFKSKS